MATTSYGTPYVEAADLVSGYPSTSLTLADRVDDISFKGNGVNNQTGTTYTLDILDAGKTITLSNSSAVTVTIPTNTAEAIEIGSIVRFNNKGAGIVTIQPDGGVTLNGGNLTLPQFAAVQIVKLDTNTWGQVDSVATTPGLVHIATSSFSSASTVSINNCFTSTYANYRIILTVTGVNYDGNVYLRLRSNGTDHTTGQYYTGLAGATSAGADSNIGQNATSLIVLMTVDGGSPGGYYCSAIDINSPQLSFHKSLSIVSSSFTTAGTYRGLAGGGALDNTSAFDGFTIGTDGPGGSTFSGYVRVYGYRN